MEKIRVPSLAENVNEATVGMWLVNVGDLIEPGQGIVELLTEKAEFTLESDYSGTVSAILATEKSVMPVGSYLCLLDATPDEIAEATKENEIKIDLHLSSPTVQLSNSEVRRIVDRPKAGGIRATPSARRLAKENGIDLTEVAASLGLDGIIKDEHVKQYLSKQ